MEEVREYDAIIVGAGQGGVPLSRTLAQRGWRTALVERKHIGGSCINEGCTPTKTMLASARVAHLARRADDYGVLTGAVSVDMTKVRQRKRDVVESWRSGSEERLRSTDNLDLLWGEARFVGRHRLDVSRADGTALRLQAPHIFVDTGSRPAIPELPGLDAVPYLTSTTIIELDVVPEHLLVIGGGYVAVEFGQMFRRFGSEVTLVQRGEHILSREDPDVSELMASILEEDGVTVLRNAQATSVRPGTDGGMVLELETPNGGVSVSGSHLLVATGRRPNTDALDPRAAGLEVDDRGYLPVNERLETGVPGIYALGDVKGKAAFTHTSYDDFRIIRDNLLEGGDRSLSDRPVPYVVFTDPQLGRIGLSEQEAEERGLEVQIFHLPMEHVARAIETGETRGALKAIVDRTSDRILGCATLGVDGGELMALLEVAMLGGVTAAQLREAVFAHPSLAESLNNLFASPR